jgi:hypothetical protein
MIEGNAVIQELQLLFEYPTQILETLDSFGQSCTSSKLLLGLSYAQRHTLWHPVLRRRPWYYNDQKEKISTAKASNCGSRTTYCVLIALSGSCSADGGFILKNVPYMKNICFYSLLHSSDNARCRSCKAMDLHSRGDGFDSRSGNRLSLLRVLVVFLSPSR